MNKKTQQKDYYDPTIWGPHYWFFLHTVTRTYPSHPNEITKRKYYDLIQNMPLFIPNEEEGNHFAKLLDNYPVTPYLVSKSSFSRWMHFMHNKMNRLLDKKEITYLESLEEYDNYYLPKIINSLGLYYNPFLSHFYYFVLAITFIAFIMSSIK